MKKLTTKTRPQLPATVRPVEETQLRQIRGGVDGVKDHSV